MATEAGAIFYRVSADMSNFNRGMTSMDRSVGRSRGVLGTLGSSIFSIGKTAAIAAGVAGLGAIAVTLKAGFSEWQNSIQVAAQTEAVLKSTGGAANVTAKQVDALAVAMMQKSGIDDEAIKVGENMLLTFSSIRNEVGQGNDVFTRATQAVTDMDVAMTHGNTTSESLSKTAILVGKALNDPVKGATALRRVGVQLTDSQTKLIAELVKSGDVMGAQKVILGELTKEFGGSAEAAGKTLPGQLKILRESFRNMAGQLVGAAAPAIATVTTALSGFIQKLTDAKGAHDKLQVVFDGLKGLAGSAFSGLQAAFRAIDWSRLWDGIKFNAQKIIDRIQQELKTADWTAIGRGIGQSLITVLNFGKELGQKLTVELVKAVLNINWKQVAVGIVQGLAGEGSLSQKFRNVITKSLDLNPITKVPIMSGEFLRHKIVEGFTQGSIEDQIKGKLAADLKSATKKAADTVVVPASAAATQIGSAIMAGAAAGAIANYLALAQALIRSVLAAIGVAGAGLKGSGDFMFTKRAIGKPMAEGTIAGFIAYIQGLAGAVSGSLQSAVKASLSVVNSLQAQIDKITKAREDSDNAAAVRSAQAALKAAIKDGKGVADARRALNQALETITLTGLNRRLAIEQAAYDRQHAADERAAAKREATIQKSLDRTKALAVAAADKASAAWSKVQDMILSAFDKVSSAFKSPAQKELDLIAARRKQEDLTRAVADAEDALTAARHDGDPAGITAAEKALARAREDITVASLEVQASAQQKAWDDLREGQRTQLDARLTALGANLVKVGASYNDALGGIVRIMAQFGVPFADAGKTLGDAFGTALVNAVVAAAATVRNVLGGAAGPSPDNQPGSSPVGDLRGYASSPHGVRLARGGIVSSPTMALIGEHGPEAVVPLSSGGGGVGGNTYVSVTVQGSLIHERQLEQVVYDALVNKSRRSGALFSRTVGATA